MASLAAIKAITFDVGGTLIKPWPSVGHVYSEVAARHGKKIPPGVLNPRFGHAWRTLKNFNHTREEWAVLVAKTFTGLWDGPITADSPFFSELYNRFSEPEAWHIFEDALPALNSLAARGINLGIISNWDERLCPLLVKLNLEKYFQAIIISCDIGFSKPSPVIFEHAAKKLGLPPQHILHVGDSPDHDIAGAQNAGYQSLLLDREAEDSTESAIKSLAALDVV